MSEETQLNGTETPKKPTAAEDVDQKMRILAPLLQVVFQAGEYNNVGFILVGIPLETTLDPRGHMPRCVFNMDAQAATQIFDMLSAHFKNTLENRILNIKQ